MAYAEAARRVEEGNGTEGTEQDRLRVGGKEIKRILNIDKRTFLAFIAMVINWSSEIKTKSERIKMVVHAAK